MAGLTTDKSSALKCKRKEKRLRGGDKLLTLLGLSSGDYNKMMALLYFPVDPRKNGNTALLWKSCGRERDTGHLISLPWTVRFWERRPLWW